jgi:hypothetical protein
MAQTSYQIFDAVAEYRADPTGGMDATVQVQNAIDAANNFAMAGNPAMVVVPPGTYKFSGAGVNPYLKIKTGVILQGSFAGSTDHGSADGSFGNLDGTIFKITANEDPATAQPAFCQMSPNSAIRGISFQWPNQNDPNFRPPPKHTYPYAIGPDPNVSGPIGNVVIENIELLNAWLGIDLTSMVRHTVRNVLCQAFSVGVLIDNLTEPGGKLENVHLFPGWSGFAQTQFETTPPIAEYQFMNGTGFLIKGVIGERLTNCCALGYNITSATM